MMTKDGENWESESKTELRKSYKIIHATLQQKQSATLFEKSVQSSQALFVAFSIYIPKLCIVCKFNEIFQNEQRKWPGHQSRINN